MKTAVELFIEQLEAQGESWENVSIGRIQISIKVEDYLKLIEQAKEMEKEQREKEFINGYKTRALASDLEFDEVSEIMAKRLFNGKL
jgi:hypothetical protein